MLHLAAIIKSITSLNGNEDDDGHLIKDYGYWGHIKDTKNSEFYISNKKPYSDTPPHQYGYWGIYEDENSNVIDNNDEMRQSNGNNAVCAAAVASNNSIKNNNNNNNVNKRIINIFNSNNDDTQITASNKNFKLTIETKYNSDTSLNQGLYNEEIVIKSNLNATNSNNKLKQISFLHLSNVLNDCNDNQSFLEKFENILKVYQYLVQKHNPIRLFSGDLLSLTTNSTISNTEKLFNLFKFHASIYGINDLCYNNLQKLENFTQKTNSIWLMSNIFDIKKQYMPITKCNIMMIIDINNVKIGIMGLAHNADVIDLKQIKYVDYVSEANRLSKELKNRGANIIIVLTQMDFIHNEYLANNCELIDVIFSGHESSYNCKLENNCWIIANNGSNLKELTLFKLYLDDSHLGNDNRSKIVDVNVTKITINSDENLVN